MEFLDDLLWKILPLERSSELFSRYQRYLESIRKNLPPAVWEFAAADWHNDPTDHA